MSTRRTAMSQCIDADLTCGTGAGCQFDVDVVVGPNERVGVDWRLPTTEPVGSCRCTAFSTCSLISGYSCCKYWRRLRQGLPATAITMTVGVVVIGVVVGGATWRRRWWRRWRAVPVVGPVKIETDILQKPRWRRLSWFRRIAQSAWTSTSAIAT